MEFFNLDLGCEMVATNERLFMKSIRTQNRGQDALDAGQTKKGERLMNKGAKQYIRANKFNGKELVGWVKPNKNK